MASRPFVEGLAWYRTFGDTGPLLRVKQRFLRYQMEFPKDDAYLASGTWSAYSNLEQCGTATNWALCGDGHTKVLTITSGEDINYGWYGDAVTVRFRVKNESSGAIWIDQVGLGGGTTP